MSDVHTKLGDYTLIRKIGSGGMAEVWMAERAMMGAHKTVALKLLNAVSREKQEYRDMFLDEARLSMLLNNSAIVQIFEAGECEGECFMAMEWIDGINLSQLNTMMWGEQQQLPVHVAAYIAGEVLRALDHAHNLRTQDSASIVHRDVSPQNVMLSVAGEVKLMDFGVARFSTEETAGIHVKGKLRYMPPEQLQGQSRDPTVDLFAVGAVLHEMLDGRRFRDAFDDIQLLPTIMNGVVPPLSRPQAIPAGLRRVLDALLAADPKRRVQSARGALRMLTEWPGYRNASIELEPLVKHYRALLPPLPESGSGLSGSVKSRIQARVAASTDTDQESSAQRRAWHPGVNPPTGTTLDQLDPDSVDDTSVGRSRAAKRGRSARVAALIVAFAGLAVGTMSVIFFKPIAGFEPGLGPDPSASADASAAAPVTPPTEDTPAPPVPSSEPVAVPQVNADPVEAEPEPVVLDDDLVLDESEKPDETPTEPEPSPAEQQLEPPDEGGEGHEGEPEKKKAPRQKVSVTFIANEFRYVHVKVGRKELILQPTKTIELLDGRHMISIRTAEGAEWQRLGRGRFTPGHSYEVLMTRPGGFVVRQVD